MARTTPCQYCGFNNWRTDNPVKCPECQKRFRRYSHRRKRFVREEIK